MSKRDVNREDVLSIACPYCRAKAGDYCIGSLGQERDAFHSDRWQVARGKTSIKREWEKK